MNLAFISHPDCLDHRMGAHHVEVPERLHAITDRLIASGIEILLTHYDAPLAEREALLRVHDADYVEMIFANAPTASDVLTWVDGDTAMSAGTLNAARRAAGAAMLGVDLVMTDKHHAAFCAVRPPGHHAERHQAMGFCFFNNVAVGAAHAMAEHALKRIAIVDFDVHHGNGTENIFAGDERVLFCSSFQHPFYPGSGADSKAPNVINLPLPARTDGAAFRSAVEQSWLPRLDDFKPDLIMISAGFDGHAEDDMAHFMLREPDYAWITHELHDLAARYAQDRVVSVLEGGYALSALGRSVGTHIDELIGHG
ncbi:histone deacetylase family protein [Thiorhodovibrio frisius]|uniref:Deacetylase, histone deacetylase/acetoin utilization protein n=1 Tax=Thiorhodovibrio frisius TaxID=631362 RepID=H8YY81_9GAMM|nr:histone deacetylase family protein [Thiorhodovibrio frisius]EIC23407.1 deacetylase, histone deacetylase/acetoin utilization protein [Thiorhodovibrio frisius]WPL23511.1 Histone deacetylase-like amidohydrolase [Thiorhodovibrio frisius]